MLRRVNYAKSDLLASENGKHDEDAVKIRRIKDVTIFFIRYPPSKRRKLNADPKALASWEDE
jgi:hypothetical protein